MYRWLVITQWVYLYVSLQKKNWKFYLFNFRTNNRKKNKLLIWRLRCFFFVPSFVKILLESTGNLLFDKSRAPRFYTLYH